MKTGSRMDFERGASNDSRGNALVKVKNPATATGE
jgi:hypothetical protein